MQLTQQRLRSELLPSPLGDLLYQLSCRRHPAAAGLRLNRPQPGPSTKTRSEKFRTRWLRQLHSEGNTTATTKTSRSELVWSQCERPELVGRSPPSSTTRRYRSAAEGSPKTRMSGE